MIFGTLPSIILLVLPNSGIGPSSNQQEYFEIFDNSRSVTDYKKQIYNCIFPYFDLDAKLISASFYECIDTSQS